MKHKDITETLVNPNELLDHNLEIYNDALRHYNIEFTVLFEERYKELYGFTKFPTFSEYFCLVYVPSLHSEDYR